MMEKIARTLVVLVILGWCGCGLATVMVDNFDTGYTDWQRTSSYNYVVQPQGNVGDPKMEGTGSMQLLTDRSGTGYIGKDYSPISIAGENAFEFDIYLSDDTGLAAGSGLNINFVSDYYFRTLYFNIGAGEIAPEDRGKWVTVHLATEDRYSTVDDAVLPFASLTGSTFNGKPLSSANGSAAWNSMTGSGIEKGFIGNLQRVEIGMGSDNGSNKYWYLDDLQAVPEPATLVIFGLSAVGILIKRNSLKVSR